MPEHKCSQKIILRKVFIVQILTELINKAEKFCRFFSSLRSQRSLRDKHHAEGAKNAERKIVTYHYHQRYRKLIEPLIGAPGMI